MNRDSDDEEDGSREDRILFERGDRVKESECVVLDWMEQLCLTLVCFPFETRCLLFCEFYCLFLIHVCMLVFVLLVLKVKLLLLLCLFEFVLLAL